MKEENASYEGIVVVAITGGNHQRKSHNRYLEKMKIRFQKKKRILDEERKYKEKKEKERNKKRRKEKERNEKRRKRKKKRDAGIAAQLDGCDCELHGVTNYFPDFDSSRSLIVF